MLDSVGLSLGGVAGVEDKVTGQQKSLSQTYDQFLTMLTTQLKNQDPLNPMDSSQFTNQLVSMAGVEQSISQTAKLDELIKLNQASTVNSAVLGYMGMQVEYAGDKFTYAGGTAIQFNYNLADDAADTTVNIYDKDDKLVWTGPGDKAKGDHSIVWPGTDQDGKRVAVGAYRLEVVAKDASQGNVAVTTPVTNFSFTNSSQMTLKYNLAAESKATKVSIVDKDGNVVWTGTGETAAGDHSIVWPGVDSNGLPVAAGNYSVQVGAQDNDGKAIKTATTVPALVTGVEANDGAINLVIGNQKVPISTVKSVHLPS